MGKTPPRVGPRRLYSTVGASARLKPTQQLPQKNWGALGGSSGRKLYGARLQNKVSLKGNWEKKKTGRSPHWTGARESIRIKSGKWHFSI